MINAELLLFHTAEKALLDLYGLSGQNISFQKTRKEFEGDFTLVTFPFAKAAKKSPEDAGQEIGAYFVTSNVNVASFNVIKGFLNIVLSDHFWLQFFNDARRQESFGIAGPGTSGKTIMLEYSSPNTNKPLHLGHVRNNLLGNSVARILQANGHEVIKANLVNDRGIHICKSMLAWKKWANGETPVNTGMKGDHLVGKYYVRFDRELKMQLQPVLAEIESGGDLSFFDARQQKDILAQLGEKQKQQNILIAKREVLIAGVEKAGLPEDIMNALHGCVSGQVKCRDVVKMLETIDKPSREQAAAIKEIKSYAAVENRIDEADSAIREIAQLKCEVWQEAAEMLRKWEAGDKDVRALWSMMNGWVYDGFSTTYKSLGVDFDKYYYESHTYLLGKEIVSEGLSKKVFYKKDNGSVAIDLTPDGLDEKIVLRSDGTSVYITQDLGTAIERFKEYPALSQLIYTVGNEQDYHFRVLFKTLEKLGYAWATECYHLSYGMVELPHGKMKSREGTVVDADDLIGEMIRTAEETTKELGKVEGFSDEELSALYRIVGMGALKYFILKVDPKKKMLFDPKESIDFNGHTGPFIQYTYARIRSVLRKAGTDHNGDDVQVVLSAAEKDLIRSIYGFGGAVTEAGATYSPAVIANYAYDLTKLYNRFYHEHQILKEENAHLRFFRLRLSELCSQVIRQSMSLLGIDVPEKM